MTIKGLKPNCGNRDCSLCGKTVRIDAQRGVGLGYGIWVNAKLKYLFHVYCLVPNYKEVLRVIKTQESL
jgi:hypothetical protein